MFETHAENFSYKIGSPTPLGVDPIGDQCNFALFSQSAKTVTLGLFKPGNFSPIATFFLDPKKNKSGAVWHILIDDIPKNSLYAYQIDEGPWVIDPYARMFNSSEKWGEEKEALLAQVFPPADFDWEGDAPLQLPFEELSIYEMHVRGFTQDPSSQVSAPGTFLGLIEKIHYLKDLGINAIELLPICEFDETANIHEGLCNYWGYSTINFFSVMPRYASQASQAIRECKMLIKALHKAGMEVILDMVFNHTSEGNHLGPTLCFRGIDNKTYYILDPDGNPTNYTGCGNTVNCNDPAVIDLIVSSLCYWVQEMHVDGFRFDLASIFCRGANGEVLENPPLLEAINASKILANTKQIAEPWDCGGLYQVGSFPGGGRFAEWNGNYRDVVRRFLKGTDGQVGAFASAVTGSKDLYGKNKFPYHSINFVTAHDGFTLHDLVSYNEKHNQANGEENRDGNDWNESWNCGHEGPTDDPAILGLRQRQMRNFIVALCLSVGTPLFLMGDEYGHSRHGNNNAYCQDNQKNFFLWDQIDGNEGLHSFFKRMLSLRKQCKELQRTEFLSENSISWHGHEPHSPDWGEKSRFIAYSIGDLFVAFNAHFEPAMIHLPSLSEGKYYERLVDTSLPDNSAEIHHKYFLSAHSTLVLQCLHKN